MIRPAQPSTPEPSPLNVTPAVKDTVRALLAALPRCGQCRKAPATLVLEHPPAINSRQVCDADECVASAVLSLKAQCRKPGPRSRADRQRAKLPVKQRPLRAAEAVRMGLVLLGDGT